MTYEERKIQQLEEIRELLYERVAMLKVDNETLEEELKKEKKLKWCVLAGAMFGVTASCILQHFNLW